VRDDGERAPSRDFFLQRRGHGISRRAGAPRDAWPTRRRAARAEME
jgi:hypothetical protein